MTLLLYRDNWCVLLQVSSPEDTHNFHAAPDAPVFSQKTKYVSTGVFKDF